jgi:hypothetical protein
MSPSTIERHTQPRTPRRSQEDTFCHGDIEALDKESIAEASSRQISRMTRVELARLVLASPLPGLRADLHEHLYYLDRPSLERIAHLARLCCRNQDERTATRDVYYYYSDSA